MAVPFADATESVVARVLTTLPLTVDREDKVGPKEMRERGRADGIRLDAHVRGSPHLGRMGEDYLIDDLVQSSHTRPQQ